MSDVVYGNVLLRNVTMREFVETPIRDPSHTDIWYTEYVIRVASLVNSATWNLQQVNPPGALSVNPTTSNIGASMAAYQPGQGNVAAIQDSTAAALQTLQGALDQDRQSFLLVLNSPIQSGGLDNNPYNYVTSPNASVRVIVADPSNKQGSKSPDVDNGPKVIELRVTQITPSTIQVEFGVKVCLSGCAKNPAILGNRFAQSDDYDESFRCRRSWTGRMRMATTKTKLADFRSTVLPPLQNGFKRKRMHFAQSQDGLELGYEIIDEEMVGAAPPWPAIRMRGKHTESFGMDGVIAVGNITLRLDGAADASKSDLLVRAMEVCFKKIGVGGFTKSVHQNRGWIRGMTMANDFSDDANAIEVAIEFQRNNGAATGTDGKPISGQEAQASLAARRSFEFLTTPMVKLGITEYDPDRAVVTDAFGTAGTVGIVACLLQDPCAAHDYRSLIGSSGAGSSKKGGVGGKTSPGSEADDTKATLSISSAGISDSLGSIPYDSKVAIQPYTFSQVDMIRHADYHRIQLPIAAEQVTSQGQAQNQDTAVVVTLGPPTMQLIVRMKHERMNAWPEGLRETDFTDDSGIKYKFLDSKNNKRPPRPTGAGDLLYAVDYEYRLSMSRPPRSGENLSVSSLPWTTTKTDQAEAGQTTALIPPNDGTNGIS